MSEGLKIFLSTFALLFVAELGDKTQLAVLSMTAKHKTPVWIFAGATLALVGFGGSAHIALQIAVAWGCEVHVISRHQAALDRARAMGACWTGMNGARLPRPVDPAVSFAPVGSVIPEILQNLRRGGTLSLAGIYLDRVPELDYDRHLFQEKRIVSTTANTRADARELLALASRLDIRTAVQTFALAEANDALARLKEDRLEAQAAVLRIGGD
mgnify:CR=1 FL=1